MQPLNRKPQLVKPGQRQLPPDVINDLTRALIRQIRGDGSINVQYLDDRIMLSLSNPNPQFPDESLYTKQFVVLQEFDDYLLCTPYAPVSFDGANFAPPTYFQNLLAGNADTIYVAKPFLLQRAPWDQNINGQVNPVILNTDPSVSTANKSVIYKYTSIGYRKAYQAVTGAFFQNEFITPNYFLGDIITAGAVQSPISGPSGEQIEWMDMNTAARSWMGDAAGGTNIPPPTSGGGSNTVTDTITTVINVNKFVFVDNPAPTSYGTPTGIVTLGTSNVAIIDPFFNGTGLDINAENKEIQGQGYNPLGSTPTTPAWLYNTISLPLGAETTDVSGAIHMPTRQAFAIPFKFDEKRTVIGMAFFLNYTGSDPTDLGNPYAGYQFAAMALYPDVSRFSHFPTAPACMTPLMTLNTAGLAPVAVTRWYRLPVIGLGSGQYDPTGATPVSSMTPEPVTLGPGIVWAVVNAGFVPPLGMGLSTGAVDAIIAGYDDIDAMLGCTRNGVDSPTAYSWFANADGFGGLMAGRYSPPSSHIIGPDTGKEDPFNGYGNGASGAPLWASLPYLNKQVNDANYPPALGLIFG